MRCRGGPRSSRDSTNCFEPMSRAFPSSAVRAHFRACVAAMRTKPRSSSARVATSGRSSIPPSSTLRASRRSIGGIRAARVISSPSASRKMATNAAPFTSSTSRRVRDSRTRSPIRVMQASRGVRTIRNSPIRVIRQAVSTTRASIDTCSGRASRAIARSSVRIASPKICSTYNARPAGAISSSPRAKAGVAATSMLPIRPSRRCASRRSSKGARRSTTSMSKMRCYTSIPMRTRHAFAFSPSIRPRSRARRGARSCRNATERSNRLPSRAKRSRCTISRTRAPSCAFDTPTETWSRFPRRAGVASLR